MNDENQVDNDKKEQERKRDFDKEQRESRTGRGGMAGNTIDGASKALAGKDGLKNFESKLGKGAKKIEAPEHSEGAWIVAIMLAVVKDLLDIGTIELASGIDWIVDAIIGVSMFFLFGRQMKLARKLIGAAGPAIMEMVPGLGFLPIWTLAVLYMWVKSEGEEE